MTGRRRELLRSAESPLDSASDAVEPRSSSRRGVLGALGGLSLVSVVGTATATTAGRRRLARSTAGDHAGREGVDLAIYRAQTDRTAAVDLFYEKAQYLLEQLRQAGTLTGWRVTLYDTDRDSVDNNRGGDWGSYDVHRILTREGWTDEDAALWFTGRAKVWDGDSQSHEWQSVSGGSAGFRTPFDRGTVAQGWMSTANDDDRVIAHGAAMELMHTMVDGGLDPVASCHGGRGEHSLGNAIHEYNADYGAVGYYGSPIAAGPHTWERGACATGVDEKDGITFTLSHCTKRAVAFTKRDRLPGQRLDPPERPCGGPATLTGRARAGEVVRHTYRPPPGTDGLTLALDGPDGADLDLLVTADGRAPGPDDSDARTWGTGADESLTLDAADLGEAVGVGVYASAGGGEYTVTVEPHAGDGPRGPRATIDAPATVTESERVRFDASGSHAPDGSLVAHDWAFGDGTRASGPVVEHAFEDPDEYAVRLRVTDDDGATDAARHVVTVEDDGPWWWPFDDVF